MNGYILLAGSFVALSIGMFSESKEPMLNAAIVLLWMGIAALPT